MARYIDAEFVEKEIASLIAKYEKLMPEWSLDDMLLTSDRDAAIKFGYKADGVGKALEIVNKAPTADVEPVKHGHWIDGFPENYERGITAQFNCSVCGRRAGISKVRTYKYCPKCGARMDGGVK